ncbi:Ldh family oxidoreductase [Streptomyces sp. NPDC050564]|uniref:Ldh family oxidoreductase n=1 Tax=Streptomyces sp. NPDC050564 TaxID=3365631 RepID=UPI0037A69241
MDHGPRHLRGPRLADQHRQNALLIAIDPAAFGDAEDFAATVDATLSTLKGLPSADGAEGVFYPGERSAAVAVERAEQRGTRGAEGVTRTDGERREVRHHTPRGPVVGPAQSP